MQKRNPNQGTLQARWGINPHIEDGAHTFLQRSSPLSEPLQTTIFPYSLTSNIVRFSGWQIRRWRRDDVLS